MGNRSDRTDRPARRHRPHSESITADVLLVNSENLERIDRMIMKAEGAATRRCARSSAAAQALRRVSDDVVDAEFVDVAHDPITNTASFDSSVIIAGCRCRRSGLSGLPSRLQLFGYHRDHDPPPIFFRNRPHKPLLGP
jgi:hypothetical protein